MRKLIQKPIALVLISCLILSTAEGLVADPGANALATCSLLSNPSKPITISHQLFATEAFSPRPVFLLHPGNYIRGFWKVARERLNRWVSEREKITVYHGVEIDTIPNILRYGLYGEIGTPTLGSNPYAASSGVALAFKINRKMVGETSSETGILFLKGPAKVPTIAKGLMARYNAHLQNPKSSFFRRFYHCIDAEKAGLLGWLDPSTLDIDKTLSVNKKRWEEGVLSDRDYRKLRMYVEAAARWRSNMFAAAPIIRGRDWLSRLAKWLKSPWGTGVLAGWFLLMGALHGTSHATVTTGQRTTSSGREGIMDASFGRNNPPASSKGRLLKRNQLPSRLWPPFTSPQSSGAAKRPTTNMLNNATPNVIFVTKSNLPNTPPTTAPASNTWNNVKVVLERAFRLPLVQNLVDFVLSEGSIQGSLTPPQQGVNLAPVTPEETSAGSSSQWARLWQRLKLGKWLGVLAGGFLLMAALHGSSHALEIVVNAKSPLPPPFTKGGYGGIWAAVIAGMTAHPYWMAAYTAILAVVFTGRRAKAKEKTAQKIMDALREIKKEPPPPEGLDQAYIARRTGVSEPTLTRYKQMVPQIAQEIEGILSRAAAERTINEIFLGASKFLADIEVLEQFSRKRTSPRDYYGAISRAIDAARAETPPRPTTKKRLAKLAGVSYTTLKKYLKKYAELGSAAGQVLLTVVGCEILATILMLIKKQPFTGINQKLIVDATGRPLDRVSRLISAKPRIGGAMRRAIQVSLTHGLSAIHQEFQGVPFTAQGLQARWPGVDESVAREALNALVQAGVLEESQPMQTYQLKPEICVLPSDQIAAIARFLDLSAYQAPASEIEDVKNKIHLGLRQRLKIQSKTAPPDIVVAWLKKIHQDDYQIAILRGLLENDGLTREWILSASGLADDIRDTLMHEFTLKKRFQGAAKPAAAPGPGGAGPGHLAPPDEEPGGSRKPRMGPFLPRGQQPGWLRMLWDRQPVRFKPPDEPKKPAAAPSKTGAALGSRVATIFRGPDRSFAFTGPPQDVQRQLDLLQGSLHDLQQIVEIAAGANPTTYMDTRLAGFTGRYVVVDISPTWGSLIWSRVQRLVPGQLSYIVHDAFDQPFMDHLMQAGPKPVLLQTYDGLRHLESPQLGLKDDKGMTADPGRLETLVATLSSYPVDVQLHWDPPREYALLKTLMLQQGWIVIELRGGEYEGVLDIWLFLRSSGRVPPSLAHWLRNLKRQPGFSAETSGEPGASGPAMPPTTTPLIPGAPPSPTTPASAAAQAKPGPAWHQRLDGIPSPLLDTSPGAGHLTKKAGPLGAVDAFGHTPLMGVRNSRGPVKPGSATKTPQPRTAPAAQTLITRLQSLEPMLNRAQARRQAMGIMLRLYGILLDSESRRQFSSDQLVTLGLLMQRFLLRGYEGSAQEVSAILGKLRSGKGRLPKDLLRMIADSIFKKRQVPRVTALWGHLLDLAWNIHEGVRLFGGQAVDQAIVHGLIEVFNAVQDRTMTEHQRKSRSYTEQLGRHGLIAIDVPTLAELKSFVQWGQSNVSELTFEYFERAGTKMCVIASGSPEQVTAILSEHGVGTGHSHVLIDPDRTGKYRVIPSPADRRMAQRLISPPSSISSFIVQLSPKTNVLQIAMLTAPGKRWLYVEGDQAVGELLERYGFIRATEAEIASRIIRRHGRRWERWLRAYLRNPTEESEVDVTLDNETARAISDEVGMQPAALIAVDQIMSGMLVSRVTSRPDQAPKALERGEGVVIALPLSLEHFRLLINSNMERSFWVFSDGDHRYLMVLPEHQKPGPDWAYATAPGGGALQLAMASGHSHPRFTSAEPSGPDDISSWPERDDFIVCLKDSENIEVSVQWAGESTHETCSGHRAIKTLRRLGIIVQLSSGAPREMMGGAQAAVERGKLMSPPKGSPLGLFDFLFAQDGLWTAAQIALKLGLKTSTLKPDIRALVTHLGLARADTSAEEPGYELYPAVRSLAHRIRPLLQDLQNQHGYRPKVEEIKKLRPQIEEILNPPAGAPPAVGAGRSVADASIPDAVTGASAYRLLSLIEEADRLRRDRPGLDAGRYVAEQLGINPRLLRRGFGFNLQGHAEVDRTKLPDQAAWWLRNQVVENVRLKEAVRAMVRRGRNRIAAAARAYFVAEDPRRPGLWLAAHEMLHDIFLNSLSSSEQLQFIRLVQQAARRHPELVKPIGYLFDLAAGTLPFDQSRRKDPQYVEDASTALLDMSELFAEIAGQCLGLPFPGGPESRLASEVVGEYLPFFEQIKLRLPKPGATHSTPGVTPPAADGSPRPGPRRPERARHELPLFPNDLIDLAPHGIHPNRPSFPRTPLGRDPLLGVRSPRGPARPARATPPIVIADVPEFPPVQDILTLVNSEHLALAPAAKVGDPAFALLFQWPSERAAYLELVKRRHVFSRAEETAWRAKADRGVVVKGPVIDHEASLADLSRAAYLVGLGLPRDAAGIIVVSGYEPVPYFGLLEELFHWFEGEPLDGGFVTIGVREVINDLLQLMVFPSEQLPRFTSAYVDWSRAEMRALQARYRDGPGRDPNRQLPEIIAALRDDIDQGATLAAGAEQVRVADLLVRHIRPDDSVGIRRAYENRLRADLRHLRRAQQFSRYQPLFPHWHYVSPAPAAGLVNKSVAADHRIESYRILVVDDEHPGNPKEILESAGFQHVDVAIQGEEALEIVDRQKEPYDLFVIGEQMFIYIDGKIYQGMSNCVVKDKKCLI